MKAALAPWRRRLVIAASTLLAFVVFARVLGITVQVWAFGALVAAVFSLGWFLVDHQGASHQVLWPLSDLYRTQGFRGSDFRTTNLTKRLIESQRGVGADTLDRDLHQRLTRIIDTRLLNTHGITREEEPKWAQQVMPPALWTFVSSAPPTDLHRPAVLDTILTAIEKW